jgi:hypothetical protein
MRLTKPAVGIYGFIGFLVQLLLHDMRLLQKELLVWLCLQ